MDIKSSECHPVELIKELKQTFEGYKASLGKESIQLGIHVPAEEVLFKTDSFRLRQILTNLVSNAIKFTEDGKVEIGLRIKNNRMLEFSVEDTGIGLTKEELNTVFSRFKRSSQSEEKNIAGTGLGLSISKNLVERSRLFILPWYFLTNLLWEPEPVYKTQNKPLKWHPLFLEAGKKWQKSPLSSVSYAP